jgi:hypothetical protein
MGFIATLTIVLIGCSSSSPDSVAEGFFRHIAAGSFDKALDLVDMTMPEGTKKSEVEYVQGKTRASMTAMQEEINEHKGLKSIKVEKTEYSEDKKSAQVSLLLTFKDDTTKNESVKLTKTDKGWKINLGKGGF